MNDNVIYKLGKTFALRIINFVTRKKNMLFQNKYIVVALALERI